MGKKIIIGLIIGVIVIAAILTALTTSMVRSPIMEDESFGGADMMLPETPGLPNRSLSMPSFKSSAPADTSYSESVEVSEAVPSATDKKVIKNGNLNLKVSSVDRAVEDIAKIAKDNGGDIFSSNIYNRNDYKTGNVDVKVPVDNFEKTFSEIKKVATLIVHESTSGQDVTEEYVDLQAQLKNKQAEEQQFVEIMKQAIKIQDILDVTQQLSRVRGEIEMLQGRIKYLNLQTDMASISVSVNEDPNITITDSWRPWQVVKDSVNSLIKKAQGFINFVIVLVVTVIPILALYLLLAYFIYLIGKKIYAKIKSKKENISN